MILKKKAKKAHGQEVDKRLKKKDVFIKEIPQFSTNSYDVVIAIDVLEHVVDDIKFLKNLLRVSRKVVFISTPNFYSSIPPSPFHFRMYSPVALQSLLRTTIDLKKYHIQFFKGTANGNLICKVKNIPLYELKNFLFNFKKTKDLMKKIKSNWNIYEHLAAFVYKPPADWSF